MPKRDRLHFSWNRALSYEKMWNFVIGERESGKSVDSWFHIYDAFTKRNQPSIVLRRRIADITSVYIDDIETLLNKFLEPEDRIQLVYIKGEIKQGVVDVRLGEAGQEYSWQAVRKLPIFFRIIGLSNPMSRIKSLMLPNLRYMFFDEFICNTRGGEKYLADEYFMVKEIYTTFKRETQKLTIIAAANPYSVYCPFFVGLGVDTSKLKPGSFVVGPNYVIDCFKVPQELKEWILAHNPAYEFDDAYMRYAFNGEAVNDANIKIQKTEPRNFRLKYVFRMGRDFLSIHEKKGGLPSNAYGQEERFWVCKHSADWLEKIGNRRGFVVFDFGDMVDGALMMDRDWAIRLMSFKDAMNKRQVRFNSIDASYMAEDIYDFI